MSRYKFIGKPDEVFPELKTGKIDDMTKFKEGDLVKIKDTWWDKKVAGEIWIVGNPDWFDKVYLISLKSRERYMNNQDINGWANDWRIKKTQVLPTYLEKANWEVLRRREVNKMPRIFRYFIYFAVAIFIWKVLSSIDIELLMSKLL